MTNMKALRMLDHVMLQIARGFTAALLLFSGLPWAFTLLNIILALLISMAFPTSRSAAWHGVNLTLPHLFDRPGILLGLAYSVFWFATVRSLSSWVARLCLGASSAFCLFVTVVGIVPQLIHPHPSVLELMLPLGLIALIGFTSMLWTSLRTPPNFVVPGYLS